MDKVVEDVEAAAETTIEDELLEVPDEDVIEDTVKDPELLWLTAGLLVVDDELVEVEGLELEIEEEEEVGGTGMHRLEDVVRGVQVYDVTDVVICRRCSCRVLVLL